MQCYECSSDNVRSLGARFYGPAKYTKYVCEDCGEEMLISPDVEVEDVIEVAESLGYVRPESYINSITSAPKIVVSTIQNNSEVNQEFLSALEYYCDSINARLVLIPIRYKNNDGDATWYAPEVESYIVNNLIKLEHCPVKIMGNLKIVATAENPLSGLDPMSKGYSLVIGHPQVMLKTLPQHANGYPAIITTTGSISEKNYIQSKLGFKAEFNHSMSALLIEQTQDTYFFRHLNFDGEGFCDLGKYYTKDSVSDMRAEAIVTGDEHAMFADPVVANVTYTNDDSLVNILKPKVIVRHDVLDAYSISHHHRKNVFTSFAKWQSGVNDIQIELDNTIRFINDTTPADSESWIVSSNHNEHLFRWLNECDPKIEPWNAVIYHGLMYHMLLATEMTDSGAKYPDPFEMYASPRLDDNIKFLSRREKNLICDVDVGFHGDLGANGSRGTRNQFSILPTKTIIGHSHSPGITKGCYQTGTSSRLKLEYNTGPSSWHHAHCAIYENGKRQLIFIVDGKYRI